MAIKDDSGTGFLNRKGYFRFDLSGISGTIESATFHFTYAGHDSGGSASLSSYNVFGLVDGNAGEGWGESSITWNNAPGNDTGSGVGVLSSQAILLGTFTMNIGLLSPGDDVSFSSAALKDFLAADTNDLVTLIVTRQQQNLANEFIASKESTRFNPPALDVIVDGQPVPEPATGIVLGAGLIGLAAFRRRFKNQTTPKSRSRKAGSFLGEPIA